MLLLSIGVTVEYDVMADVMEVAVGELLFLLCNGHITHVGRVVSGALAVVAVGVNRFDEHLYF